MWGLAFPKGDKGSTDQQDQDQGSAGPDLPGMGMSRWSGHCGGQERGTAIRGSINRF